MNYYEIDIIVKDVPIFLQYMRELDIDVTESTHDPGKDQKAYLIAAVNPAHLFIIGTLFGVEKSYKSLMVPLNTIIKETEDKVEQFLKQNPDVKRPNWLDDKNNSQ